MAIHIYEVTAQTNKYELEEISWRSNMNFPHNTVVPVVVIGLQLAHMGLQEKVLEVLRDPTPLDKAFFFDIYSTWLGILFCCYFIFATENKSKVTDSVLDKKSLG